VKRCIYYGLSRKTWCGRKMIERDGRPSGPIMEGEYMDAIVPVHELCDECVEAIQRIRGNPTGGNAA
jgi:hypothetical protein